MESMKGWFNSKFSSKEDYLILLSGFYSALVVISNVLAFKIVKLIFYVPAGVITYPFTFLITDLVSEVFGKDEAKKVVRTGIAVSLFYVLVVKLAVFIRPAEIFGFQQQFSTVLNSSVRITLAGLIAFIVSQSVDVEIFHFWKKLTGKSRKWLRNNFSTIPSQFIDTFIFIILAFWGIYPPEDVFSMIFGQFVVKFVFAVADTPFFYLFSNLMENSLKRNSTDVQTFRV